MRTDKLSVRNQIRFKKSSSSSAAKKNTDLSSRERTIFKKAYELETLCDIEVCVLYYGHDGNLIKTWPEDQSKVRDMAERFHRLSDKEKLKKSTNLSQFLNKKINDERKTSLGTNDSKLSHKFSELEDSLRTQLRIFQNKIPLLQQTEPVQNQSLVASPSSFLSTDGMSSPVLINDPLMNLSTSLIDDQSRAASYGFTTTHLSPTLIGHPHQQWTEPLTNHLSGVYSDSFATDSLNHRQGKFSFFLYNHDEGSFSQLADQATTSLSTGLLGSQVFHLGSCSNKTDLPAMIPPYQMQAQDPLLNFDQYVASNQTPSFLDPTMMFSAYN